jgi:hypothetical protein
MAAGTEVETLKQALVAGGQASFVMDKLSKSLARHGIAIHTHWSWDKKRPPQKFPEGIDLVYICTDMIGHSLANPCVDYARETGIPYVNGTRKWAESIERLTSAGFPLHNPQENLPLILNEAIPKNRKERRRQPTESELRGVMIAMSGTTDLKKAPAVIADQLMPSVSTLAASMNAPVAESEPFPTPIITPDPEPKPEVKETAMSESTVTYEVRNKSLNPSNSLQQVYLHALIQEPDLSNEDLWSRIQTHPFAVGKRFDAQRGSSARRQLGIEVERKGGVRRVMVNSNTFGQTARAIGLKTFPPPKPLYVESDPHQTGSPQRLNAARVAKQEEQTAPPPAAPAAPAPAPKVELSSMDEIKDLITLLRVKMAEESITELHLTPDSVKYKQVKVVEGELAV